MKQFTFCYSMSGYITVEAENIDEAEALAEEQDIYWDESSTDFSCVVEDEIEEG